MQVKIPYLNLAKNKAGQRYAYYRRDGRSVAIKSLDGKPLVPGQVGFLDAYAALHAAFAGSGSVTPSPLPTTRSVEALVTAYLQSSAFTTKAAPTQRQYRWITSEIVRHIGRKSVPAIELPHALALREQFGGLKTPRKANLAVAVLSILMEHARALGWRKDNPCLRPKKLATGPGIPAWTEEEVETFLADASIDEPIRRAVALAYWTGLRVSDLVKLRKADRKDGVIQVRTGKTKADAYIPEHPRLTALLNAIPAPIQKDPKAPVPLAATLLTRAEGNPWTQAHLQHSLTAAVREVKMRPGLSFHGLRKAMHSALAEAGATDAEIEAMVPHADANMTRYYRKGADQKTLAQAGMKKLVGNGSGT